MLIDVIDKNAEQKLLATIEQANKKNLMYGTLYLHFSKLELKPGEDKILHIISPILNGRQSAIYFFQDGDIVITWVGSQKALLDDLHNALYKHLNITNKELYKYYDINAHGEELRIECKKKLEKIKPDVPEQRPSPDPVIEPLILLPEFNDLQLKSLKTKIFERNTRATLEILIVEDQAFSRTLLQGMLKQYNCHMAKDGLEAISGYAMNAPDITFLDIELPDINGHSLASLFRKADPAGYIVMLTANNYIKDVQMAKANKVQGFIAKPYSKQKIDDIIENYIKQTHKRR